MSFEITLQINNSEKNKVQKTVTDLITVTGSFREKTSITNPVITFAIDNSDFEVISQCNYLSIPILRRKYFVNEIKLVSNALWEVTAHVDVISSFASEIKANKAIIKRQETKWNLYLNDGVFKVYQNPKVLTKKFPTGFDALEFVLAIAGGDNTG